MECFWWKRMNGSFFMTDIDVICRFGVNTHGNRPVWQSTQCVNKSNVRIGDFMGEFNSWMEVVGMIRKSSSLLFHFMSTSLMKRNQDILFQLRTREVVALVCPRRCWHKKGPFCFHISPINLYKIVSIERKIVVFKVDSEHFN